MYSIEFQYAGITDTLGTDDEMTQMYVALWNIDVVVLTAYCIMLDDFFNNKCATIVDLFGRTVMSENV